LAGWAGARRGRGGRWGGRRRLVLRVRGRQWRVPLTMCRPCAVSILWRVCVHPGARAIDHGLAVHTLRKGGHCYS
jgi:hypothetical protein